MENIKDQFALALKSDFRRKGIIITIDEAYQMVPEKVLNENCSEEYLFGFLRGYRCGKEEIKNRRELDLVKGIEKLNNHHSKQNDFVKEMSTLLEELRKVTNNLKVVESKMGEPRDSIQPMHVDIPVEKPKDDRQEVSEVKKRAITEVAAGISTMSKSLKIGKEVQKVATSEDKLKILRVCVRELLYCLKEIDEDEATNLIEGVIGKYSEDVWKSAAADIPTPSKLRGAIIQELRRIAKAESTKKDSMKE